MLYGLLYKYECVKIRKVFVKLLILLVFINSANFLPVCVCNKYTLYKKQTV